MSSTNYVIFCSVLLRLRNFEVYDRIELVPPQENVAVIELPDVCEGQTSRDVINLIICAAGELQTLVVLAEPVHTMVEKETQTPRRSRWHVLY